MIVLQIEALNLFLNFRKSSYKISQAKINILSAFHMEIGGQTKRVFKCYNNMYVAPLNTMKMIWSNY
jgi:hypothetical protein